MDTQKSAASRVRHILAAMERSIDTARSRRTLAPGQPNPATSTARSMDASMNDMQVAAIVPTASANRITPASTPARNDSRANPMIGGSALIGGNPAATRVPAPPVDPNAPARLKAKPKRFESTFAAQFAQNNYRSQAG